jgi:hypothetical protein
VRGGELVGISGLAEGFNLSQFVAAKLIDLVVQCQGGSTFMRKTWIIKDEAVAAPAVPAHATVIRTSERTSPVFMGHESM